MFAFMLWNKAASSGSPKKCDINIQAEYNMYVATCKFALKLKTAAGAFMITMKEANRLWGSSENLHSSATTS
jgi:hypothetical protein